MRNGVISSVTIASAIAEDAAEVAAVRNAAAERLTRDHGRGHWSGFISEQGVLRGINTSRVLVARSGDQVVGTLRLATKKPWAIDLNYFVPSKRPLYLVDMAVSPDVQRAGVGRQLLDAATRTAHGWSADAIRLDAYDHAAGAGTFYEKCGFREVGRSTYRGVALIYYQLLL